MAKESTALEAVKYRALTVNSERFAQIIQANSGIAGLSPQQLDRVKIPSGGGVTWTVPSLTGDQEVKEIEGIIIHMKEVRAYWPDSFSGSGTPPQCSSDDAIHGVGSPGGSCLICPLSKPGSAPPKKPGELTKGQACKASRLLFLLRPDDLLPIVVSLPPTSLKPCGAYFMRLANWELFSHEAVTAITLIKEKNEDGMQYSRAEFRMVRQLNSDDRLKIANLFTMFKPFLTQTRMQPDADAY